MRNIKVGYFDLQKKTMISDIVVNDNFIGPLARYVDLVVIPVNEISDIEDAFKRSEKYKLDYIYVDSFNLLLESFLLREKLEQDIPFIFTLHTIHTWLNSYGWIVPLIREYDIIHAVSDYNKKSFFRISDKYDVHVIPLFLDVKSIRKHICRASDKKKKVITFMGRLTEEKGIDALIKCMPDIIAGVPNAHLNVIGPLSGGGIKDTPKADYVKMLEGIVRQLGPTNEIHFKGVRLGSEKYRMLSESDIVVSPTTALEESFLMVNMEAMACGVPVITTDWAANKELVRDGENGFLIDVNHGQNKKPEIDTNRLTSVIVKTLKNGRLRHKMAENALNTARRYDYRRILPRLVRILKKRPRQRYKKRWSLIRGKGIMDFRGSFNKDFLFFIVFYSRFGRKRTYAELYRDVFSKPARAAEIIPRRKSRSLAVIKRVHKDLEDFLLLKSS